MGEKIATKRKDIGLSQIILWFERKRISFNRKNCEIRTTNRTKWE